MAGYQRGIPNLIWIFERLHTHIHTTANSIPLIFLSANFVDFLAAIFADFLPNWISRISVWQHVVKALLLPESGEAVEAVERGGARALHRGGRAAADTAPEGRTF